MNPTRFEGGRTILVRSLAVAAAGLLLTLVGGLVSGVRALQAYHVAFVYWAGIALAALIINMTFQAGKARWYVVTRRVLETIPLSGALFLVLFVPVALGLSRLFPWVDPSHLDEELRRVVELRRPYLNVPFFLIRSALYFAIWIVVAYLLHAWSVRQDEEGGIALTLKQRRLGAGALPFVGLAITFAAFDWEMSLDQHLASTIFGLYYFSGSFLAAFAALVLAITTLRGEGAPGALMNADHYHALGKWLLAFVAFWGYIDFSQYLLIWIANLPEEVPWFLARNREGWLPVGIFLVVFHFLVPFFALLSRNLKRNPRSLSVIAAYILVVHYVDVYWAMMPALQQAEHRPEVHWTDLTALVGVGAAAVAFVVWRLRGRPAVPVRDPYLAESLRYSPP
jgi:hypothetical protein